MESLQNKENNADAIEEPSNAAESRPKAGFAWWAWRVMSVVVFLLGIQVLLTFVTLLMWSIPPVRAIFVGVVGIALVLGAIFLMLRPHSRKSSATLPPTKENYDKWLMAIAIAACVPWTNYFVKIPEFIEFIAFLIAVVGGIGVLIKCKLFRWRNYIVVGIAFGTVIFSIQYPALCRVQEIAHTQMRGETFASIIDDCSSLCTPTDLQNAIRSPSSGTVDDLEGATLVLEATKEGTSDSCQLSTSVLEVHLPPNLLAPKPQAVRVLVINGAIGPEIESFGIFAPKGSARLIAPILVYRWPEKELLFSSKLETGCISKDAPFKVYRRAGKALYKLLLAHRSTGNAQ